MRNFNWRLQSVFLGMAMLVFAACTTEDNTASLPAPNPTISQVIDLDPSFSLLKAALVRANLSSALNTNDITLLAPDNDAFRLSGIPDVNAINAIPVPQLQSILSYHVVTKRVPFASIPVSDTLKTVNSQNVYGSRNLNGTFLNGINIKVRDRQGSNGYIQVIERVLTPPAPNKSIASVVANDTTYSFLVKAVTRLNLLALLNNPNKLTVFAPTNAAFRAAGITDVDAVPLATLDPIIKSHVLPTNYLSKDVVPTLYYATAEVTRNVEFSTTPSFGVRRVGSGRPFSVVTIRDNICTNGILHTIDRVILP
jgi:uncharacterized surface protein with fasciclin (FAS1) repeats